MLPEQSWRKVKRITTEVVNRHGIYNLPESDGLFMIDYDKVHCRTENHRDCTLLSQLNEGLRAYISQSNIEITEEAYSFPRHMIHVKRK